MRVRFALASVILISLPMSMSLAACGLRAPSQQLVQAGDYGPPPANLEANVRDVLNDYLKDPASAQVADVEGPMKGYIWFGDGLTTNGQIAANQWRTNRYYFGWKVCVSVNGRNGFGAYTGFERVGIFIKDDHMATYYHGNLVETEFCKKNLAGAPSGI